MSTNRSCQSSFLSVPFRRSCRGLPPTVWEDAVEVFGEMDPEHWRGAPAQALIRHTRETFWRSGIHASVMKLAGELHGTGMQPTAGLFDPSPRVAEVAAQMNCVANGRGEVTCRTRKKHPLSTVLALFCSIESRGCPSSTAIGACVCGRAC